MENFVAPENERYFYYCLWTALWIVLLNIPPGPTAIPSAYRLNLIHGTISVVCATACLMGYLPESVTTPITLSYFLTDFFNICLNDFIWKVPSYQNPQNRKMEYFHHLFCATLGLMSEFTHKDFCTFDHNPFVNLMYAEFSTPFLMLWRYSDMKNEALGYIFVFTFFLCRIVYHGFFLIPECMSKCHWSVGYGFGIPYNLMNAYFFYMIMKRMFFKSSPSESRKKKS